MEMLTLKVSMPKTEKKGLIQEIILQVLCVHIIPSFVFVRDFLCVQMSVSLHLDMFLASFSSSCSFCLFQFAWFCFILFYYLS